MAVVKAIKGLAKNVQHSGGFDFSKALVDYLSQDEMIIDQDGNPTRPKIEEHKDMETHQVQELEKLCNLNIDNCKQVMNRFNISTFIEANGNEYENIKEQLTIKEIGAQNEK
jgi:hypothetical protein